MWENSWCDCCVGHYLLSLSKPELINILNSFYSGLLALSVAFATVSSIFGLFRMQAISDDLTKAYDSFRNWVIYRFEKEPAVAQYLRKELLVDKEPNSWLEKDILEHIDYYRNEDRKKLKLFVKAFDDYFDSISLKIKVRRKLYYLVLIPFLMFMLLAFFSLFMILRINLFVNFDLYSILQITFFIGWVTFFTLMFLGYVVNYSLRDLIAKNINNPKTNYN
jgi:hypothetical protein